MRSKNIMSTLAMVDINNINNNSNNNFRGPFYGLATNFATNVTWKARSETRWGCRERSVLLACVMCRCAHSRGRLKYFWWIVKWMETAEAASYTKYSISCNRLAGLFTFEYLICCQNLLAAPNICVQVFAWKCACVSNMFKIIWKWNFPIGMREGLLIGR